MSMEPIGQYTSTAFATWSTVQSILSTGLTRIAAHASSLSLLGSNLPPLVVHFGNGWALRRTERSLLSPRVPVEQPGRGVGIDLNF